jgi:hypothetical protein
MGPLDHWHDRSTLERWYGGCDLDVPDRYRRHDFLYAVYSRDGKYCTYSVW